MLFKLLRFIGAILLAILFSYLVDVCTISFFAGTAHFFANFSFENWMGFDLLRGLFVPTLITLIVIVGWVVVKIVNGSKLIMIIPMVIFTICIFTDFINLFFFPIEIITDEIGTGFWYYLGASITFLEMIICYAACSLSMIEPKDNH